jgi:hypothetical protein
LNNGEFLAHRNDEGVQMSQKSLNQKPISERLVKDIRRATHKHYSAEDKIRIVLDGLRDVLVGQRYLTFSGLIQFRQHLCAARPSRADCGDLLGEVFG